jgi:hypothetical protein
MLNIIKSKVKNINKKKNLDKLKKKNLILRYKNYVPAVRVWKNSIYSYNKNLLNLIPVTTKLTLNLIRTYFNLYNYKLEMKLRKYKLRNKLRKKSLNKLYLSDGEFKHTNDRVIITLYLYNRQKINLLIKLKKFYKKILRKKIILKKVYLIKKAMLRLWEYKQKKYLVLQKTSLNTNLILKLIKPYKIKKLNSKLLIKLKYCLYYKQLIYFNNLKYNNIYLQGLTNLIRKIYKKNVEFNLINLRSFFLNSNILIQPLKYKLRKKRKLFRYLKRIMRKIKVQPIKLIDQPKYFFDKRNLLFGNKGNALDKVFDNFILENKVNSNNLKRTILNNIKYKKLTGVRLSAAGRLTRRYTASRAQYRIKYQGNLKNIYASIKGHSYVLLRSRLQPNLDYKKLSYKSRIGSFGLKGWVSGS